MTSEVETLKTNEILRRRKLRLQQVREQSKDIAKKIRQRTKVEKLRQIVDIDAQKEKEYLDRQEIFLKELEKLHAKRLANLGVGHENANKIRQESAPEKSDLSKLRGKEAAAELRRKKQEKLDEQKKLLDRKLQAREAANELSREKTSSTNNKSSIKPCTSKEGLKQNNIVDYQENPLKITSDRDDVDKNESITKNDMATQWDLGELAHEWEPTIPVLPLPKNDNVTKEPTNDKMGSNTEQNKKLDLFAVSDEMPSSLRGGLASISEEIIPVKPSLTLVSEYLQNRALNLREPIAPVSKKHDEDLQTIRQTILKTRASKSKGIDHETVQVLDGQVLPLPSWQAENNNCGFCSNKSPNKKCASRCKQLKSNNYQKNMVPQSVKSGHHNLFSNSIPRRQQLRMSMFNNHLCAEIAPAKGNHVEKSNRQSSVLGSEILKKNSVTMYNHETRDIRDIIDDDSEMVVRHPANDEDAYSQAMKESSSDLKNKMSEKNVQDMRNRVAVTKQNVEKEYKETMDFLNSLPKDKNTKPIKHAFIDETQEQTRKEYRQRKLQQEFNKIERESRKHSMTSKSRSSVHERRRSKSKSPSTEYINGESRNFQYSWMPVPEGDGNLAIHTIPNGTKAGKSSNTVKFSDVDSYHEYRTRHRHTPPTKEDHRPERDYSNRVDESDFTQQSTDLSSVSSDSSSMENIRSERKDKSKKDLSDAEKIVIYKILDSKDVERKKLKKCSKSLKNTAKSLRANPKDNTNKSFNVECESSKTRKNKGDIQNIQSVEKLQEGVYKTVNERGDNFSSIKFADNFEEGKTEFAENEIEQSRICSCKKNMQNEPSDQGRTLVWETPDNPRENRMPDKCVTCKYSGITKSLENKSNFEQPLAATSSSSFQTAGYDKVSKPHNANYIELTDDNGQEAGKFYIGASGLLKNDAYEVVIQLRKKGDDKDNNQNSTSEKASPVKTPRINNDYRKESHITGIEIKKTKDDTNTTFQEKPKKYNKDFETFSGSGFTTHVKPSPLLRDDYDDDASINIPKKEFIDKGVCTSFSLSEDLRSNSPKLCHNSRPATSAYTQTTLSPPNTRPVLIHMSSSTSTAYMSPPEMVLPNLFKQGYSAACYDRIHRPIPSYNVESMQDANERVGCMCKRCVHLQNKNMTKKNVFLTRTESKEKNDSSCSTTRNSINVYNHDNYDKLLKNRSADRNKKNRKYYKYSGTTESNPVRSRKSKKSGISGNSNHYVRSKRPSTSSSHAQRSNKKWSSERNKTTMKSDLDPIIKNYVNKLLALSRKGLKAIEVANEDCSSIATPESSIINVPRNMSEKRLDTDNTVSLQQIKNALRQQILKENQEYQQIDIKRSDMSNNDKHTNKNFKHVVAKVPKWTPVHKVKSLNISKSIYCNRATDFSFRNRSQTSTKSKQTSSSSSKDDSSDKKQSLHKNRRKLGLENIEVINLRNTTTKNLTQSHLNMNVAKEIHKMLQSNFHKDNKHVLHSKKYSVFQPESQRTDEHSELPFADSKSTTPIEYPKSTQQKPLSQSTERENVSHIPQNQYQDPVNISSQTSRSIDSEINFVKVAENKLQNMEKIADLTEKCTQRLSSLAKVLEDVRRSKSLAYNQISTSESASDSDQKIEKNDSNVLNQLRQPVLAKDRSSAKSESYNQKIEMKENSDFIPLLTDITKLEQSRSFELHRPGNLNTDFSSTKQRGKPPPALSRLALKHGRDYVVPHELSTVVEVDSPMSVKLKNQSSQNSDQNVVLDKTISSPYFDNNSKKDVKLGTTAYANPDVLQSHINKVATADSSDDSKLQMMDLKQFNEIMLKPFISIQDYAKQCGPGIIDEGSNLEEVPKNCALTEELSSLHSDGSLPDVIAELLKRNIISEPFKYDSVSNVNSTTVSSDSTLSILALTKVREKKKAEVLFKNRDNLTETSDTLSMSSNPDLENAFKKLGMGWASSTLKKTKERLALSSSSNTSSSSLSKSKIRISKQDIPNPVPDELSTIINAKRKELQKKIDVDSTKHAEQQTCLSNSMTVKEFLTNELAKRITFTNKSNRNDTEEEFISLYETKMPDEIKNKSQVVSEDRCNDSVNSGSNRRTRTSTPVQIYKSVTYHSSSSSFTSNGLFTNADELSSVKGTSNSVQNHSTSEKDDLTIPNYSLRLKKAVTESSKSD